MNFFKIEFIQGVTSSPAYLQLQHTLEDTPSSRKIITLSLSADKLQSVSSYTREPRRLVFECLTDSWLQDHILSGTEEHLRYISHYEVKVYRNSVLIFSGIIDTSQISTDVSTSIIQITCYCKLRLLSLFSDLTHYYSLTSGYLPAWILQYFVQDIQQLIPISIPLSLSLSAPSILIPEEDPLQLINIDYSDLSILPPNGSGYTYSIQATGWSTLPRLGYIVDSFGNKVSFIFAHVVVVKAVSGTSTLYQVRTRGRIIRFFNLTAGITIEHDERSSWFSDLTTLNTVLTDFYAFFSANSVSSSQLELSALPATATLGAVQYTSFHLVGSYVKAYFFGSLLPARLHPGKSYESLHAEQTDNLKTLQAMLLLYNATLYSSASGTIILRSKSSYSATIVDIDSADVISLKLKRGDQERPDTSILDVFAGDTTLLQPLIAAHLVGFFSARFTAEIVIDQLAKYTLSLQSKIRVNSQVYAITSVEQDIVNDEYKVSAWLL